MPPAPRAGPSSRRRGRQIDPELPCVDQQGYARDHESEAQQRAQPLKGRGIGAYLQVHPSRAWAD